MEKMKEFDAVEMVRRIRDAQYELTKAMPKDERLAFYREKGREAQRELEQLAKRLDKDTG